jgi:hypothetical protein
MTSHTRGPISQKVLNLSPLDSRFLPPYYLSSKLVKEVDYEVVTSRRHEPRLSQS